MSLSGLETTLLEYVGDALVNDCGRPVPDRVLRYHGRIPDDCCTVAGLLVISWSDGKAGSSFPVSNATDRNAICGISPMFTLTVDYRTCWKVPQVNENGVELVDEQWDADAAMLADVAQCITLALLDLQCALDKGAGQDPLVEAVAGQLSHRAWLRFLDVAPIVPLGGCVGVRWRVNVGPSAGPLS